MKSERRSTALLALLLIVPVPSLGVWASMMMWPGTALGKGIYIGGKVWLVLLPFIWRLVVDRRPISLSPVRQGGLRMGVVIGLAISAIIVAGYLLIGRDLIDAEHVRQEADQNGIGTWTMYLLGMLAWVFVNSVIEEYVYRWFMFEKFEVLTGGGIAVIASALCFTVHHVIALWEQFTDAPLIIVAGSLGVFIGGVVWSWMYLRYRSIWPGWVSHAIVDVAVFGVGADIIFWSAP